MKILAWMEKKKETRENKNTHMKEVRYRNGWIFFKGRTKSFDSWDISLETFHALIYLSIHCINMRPWSTPIYKYFVGYLLHDIIPQSWYIYIYQTAHILHWYCIRSKESKLLTNLLNGIKNKKFKNRWNDIINNRVNYTDLPWGSV